MIPAAAIVRMITALAEATTEVCKTLQTPEGQATLVAARTDKAKWDSFWLVTAPKWAADLFSGKLFETPQAKP